MYFWLTISIFTRRKLWTPSLFLYFVKIENFHPILTAFVRLDVSGINVIEPNSSSKHGRRVKFFSLILCLDEDMNQSESFVGLNRSWYDCQSSTDIKFLNYSGNVYCLNTSDVAGIIVKFNVYATLQSYQGRKKSTKLVHT